MRYSFTCYGHENITARHKTTLEFTKDMEMGLKGDCIIGVKADFSLIQLKKFIKSLNNNKIAITIQTINNNSKNKIVERINAEINPNFNSDREMVIRKTNFVSDRTFAIRADKAAFELNRDLIKNISNGKQKVTISLD